MKQEIVPARISGAEVSLRRELWGRTFISSLYGARHTWAFCVITFSLPYEVGPIIPLSKGGAEDQRGCLRSHSLKGMETRFELSTIYFFTPSGLGQFINPGKSYLNYQYFSQPAL